jgi:hypothetical protein
LFRVGCFRLDEIDELCLFTCDICVSVNLHAALLSDLASSLKLYINRKIYLICIVMDKLTSIYVSLTSYIKHQSKELTVQRCGRHACQ